MTSTNKSQNQHEFMNATETINTAGPTWDQIAGSIQAELTQVEALLLQKRRLNKLRIELAVEHMKDPQMAIVAEVAITFGVRVEQIMSRKRPDHIALPRQVAMVLLRENQALQLTLEDIGEFFGGRDHGTVIHAIKAVKERCETDGRLSRIVNELRERLTATVPASSPRIQPGAV